MKTLKANNFQQAVKELSNLDKGLVKKLIENIKHSDRRMYHIICVRISPRPNQAKNEVTFSVVQMHKPGFERLEKNFVYQSMSKIIILHDPSNLEEEDPKFVPSQLRESTEARVRREMKEQHELEIAEKVKEGIAEAMEAKEEKEKEEKKDAKDIPTGDQDDNDNGDNGDVDVIEIDIEEALKLKKVADIEAFATVYEIDLSGATNLEQRKAKIAAWNEERKSK